MFTKSWSCAGISNFASVSWNQPTWNDTRGSVIDGGASVAKKPGG